MLSKELGLEPTEGISPAMCLKAVGMCSASWLKPPGITPKEGLTCRSWTQTHSCMGQGRNFHGGIIPWKHRAGYKYPRRASLSLLFDVLLLFTSNPLLMLFIFIFSSFPSVFTAVYELHHRSIPKGR